MSTPITPPQLSSDTIWILDPDPACVAMYHQTLGLNHELKVFSNFEDFAQAFHAAPSGQPRLLVADPEDAKGSPLTHFFRSLGAAGNSRHFPETLIVSRQDDLELMRFFLRVGARDYILKPIRPNELVAKIEKALLQINNRAIMILRNDLDGNEVNNLTFREHQILTVLLSRPDRSAIRDHLQEAVWNKAIVNRKTLDVHIFNLRRKLRPIGYDIVCKGQRFQLAKAVPETSDT